MSNIVLQDSGQKHLDTVLLTPTNIMSINEKQNTVYQTLINPAL